jgi:hypothetical protein
MPTWNKNVHMGDGTLGGSEDIGEAEASLVPVPGWFRQLAAKKYDSSNVSKVGRPRKAADVRELVLELARDNPGWGSNSPDGAWMAQVARNLTDAASGF